MALFGVVGFDVVSCGDLEKTWFLNPKPPNPSAVEDNPSAESIFHRRTTPLRVSLLQPLFRQEPQSRRRYSSFTWFQDYRLFDTRGSNSSVVRRMIEDVVVPLELM
ncbi:hypothetical protein P8452_52284 [Trifolium repens]|nr:hypothetical protein P8452_52284 [Trifolium repens]